MRGAQILNSNDATTDGVTTDEGAIPKCISVASFWTPIWIPPNSEWLEHASFGFWLTDALRPRVIVDLVTDGYSHAVFCQAVQALNLNSRCYGIQQDDSLGTANGQDSFHALSDHIEAHYKSFSSLIRSDSEQVRAHFEEGSIDLLHIDGFHSYKAVLAEYTAWRPLLSQSSVVLFHDTNTSIGITRLWQDLAHGHKHFEFLHGRGLGVLGVGDFLPEPVEHLFACANRPEATNHLRLAYSQLGSFISARTRCKDPQAQLRHRDLRHTQDQAALSKMELELRHQLTRQSYLSALCSLREAEISARDAEIAKKDQRIEQLREELANEKDRLKVQQNAFLNSTSWRVTAPLRLVMRYLRREGA
jgi:Methyltransferase domain